MKTSSCRRCSGPSLGPVLLLAAVLAGCAAPLATPVVHKEPGLSEWKKPGEAAAPKAPAARPARNELPPALTVTPMAPPEEPPKVPRFAADRPLPTDLIGELDLTDEADVAMVLRTLAKAGNVNILVSPNVSGTVSFAFKNIPWDQAFRSVIISAGLNYAWEGDVLRVMTLEDMKRDLEIETVLKQRADVKAERRKVEPMLIQVVPIKYSTAKNVGNTIKSIMTGKVEAGGEMPSQQTSVAVDEANNAIVVHAIRDDLDKVLTLVGQLDRAKAQVHIEARIVEATRDTARQLGVQWGAHSARVDDGRLTTLGGRGATAGGYNSDFPAQFAHGGAALTPVGMTLGLISENVGGSELLALQLTALQRKGNIKILSSPSITTLDNEAAIIKSGEERAYRETSGTGNDLDVAVEWKEAVLELNVMPHVVDDEYLLVKINARKETFDETKQQSSGEFPINKKEASTTVLLRNGETVVIGGLTVDTDSKSDAGIPWLMDFPGLGALFKNKAQAKKFDETLIFITPKIIADAR